MNYPVVNRQVCGYCGACVSVCPENAIELVDTYVSIDNNLCSKCLSCVKVCPVGALSTDMLNPDLLYNKPSTEKASINVDVLIIGGGPAGSIAARTLAEQNLEVLMVEKRQEIGTPVRCAEGISKEALLKLTAIDPKWVSAPINSGCIYAPNGDSVTLEQPNTGLVLERKIFDRDLAHQAAKAGADIWVKARAVGIIKQNGNVIGAVVRRAGIDYEIKSKVVIAADGVESRIARWAGIDTHCKNSDVDTCVQYLMTGLDNIKPDCCCFYLGHEVAPRGYAWIFPKGNGSANVGIGIGGNIDNKTALDYLN
ncbi:geranylgeranyl reductase family protein, partial [Candidatus Poribacteria bacterium]|nr:geranylgeranyl reductase family protein [Candidatus Poribacteria bacterium]